MWERKEEHILLEEKKKNNFLKPMTTIITSTATQGNCASYADVHVNHINMYVVVCQMIGPGQGSTLRRTRQKAGTEETVRGDLLVSFNFIFLQSS